MLPKLKKIFGEVIEVGNGTPHEWDTLGTKITSGFPCAIFQFAGAVPTKYSMEECYETNRRLDSAMYALSKRVNTHFFVYPSSVGVYGHLPEDEVKTVSEESDRDIRNEYARSKSEMEDTLLKEPYSRILRISSPYRQGDPNSPGLYGRFLRDRDDIVVVDPYRLQNYIEVDMLFDIIMFALENDHKIINAIAAESITNLELARRIAVNGTKVRVQAHPQKSEHGFRYLSLFHGQGARDV